MADNIEKRQNQEEEKRKRRRVYSTALINELIKERSQGYDIPYDAFFNRDLELRAPGVTFRMTDEEMEEYQKCYDDAMYYVTNYCNFMTDKGRSLVQLRDFQKNVIKTVTDEIWLDDIEEFGPKNRGIIWCASRQSGKCVSPTSTIEILEKDNSIVKSNHVTFLDLYAQLKDKLSLLNKIKYYLYKIYVKL